MLIIENSRNILRVNYFEVSLKWCEVHWNRLKKHIFSHFTSLNRYDDYIEVDGGNRSDFDIR